MTRRAKPAARVPPWYQWRSGVFVIIYAVGFLGGWAICSLQGRGYVPAYRGIAERAHAGASGAIIAALLCTLLAVAIRVWGSSFLSEERVWSKDARVDSLVVAGPFRYCRHPLYAANILLALALGSLAPLWGWSFILIGNVVFVHMLIAREERLLAVRYPEYSVYRRQVPPLLPRLSPVAKSGGEVQPSLMQGLRTEWFSLFIIAGVSAFFVTGYAWWILAGAYAIGVIVQRRIERNRRA